MGRPSATAPSLAAVHTHPNSDSCFHLSFLPDSLSLSQPLLPSPLSPEAPAPQAAGSGDVTRLWTALGPIIGL